MWAEFEHTIRDAYDYEEAMVRQNLKQKNVDLLREKTKRSKLVPRYIHDKQLLLFANACKDDTDKGSKWLHIYYKMKKNAPEFFANRDVLSDEIQNALRDQFYYSLPVFNGCNLVCHSLRNFEPKKYVFDEAIKTFIITTEACTFLNGPRDGTIFLYDLKGSSYRHLFRPSISSIRKGIDFLQTASPLEVTAFHIFNASYLMDFIFAMVKPFVKKELYERIHLHTGDNYEEFFEKYIPRSHMPSDYGGDLASCEDLHEENRKLLLSMREYFNNEVLQANLKLEDRVVESNNNEDDDDDDFLDAEDK